MLQVMFYPILTCKGGRQTNLTTTDSETEQEHTPEVLPVQAHAGCSEIAIRKIVYRS